MRITKYVNGGQQERLPLLDGSLFRKLQKKGVVTGKMISCKQVASPKFKGLAMEFKNGTTKFSFLASFDRWDIAAIVPATRKRGDGRLGRPAGPLHHPQRAKGRNVRKRRKPEEGSPVEGALLPSAEMLGRDGLMDVTRRGRTQTLVGHRETKVFTDCDSSFSGAQTHRTQEPQEQSMASASRHVRVRYRDAN